MSKEGYEVEPLLRTLQAMPDNALASVSNFAVDKPGVGRVEWHGSVDVRDLVIGTDVAIRTKKISLYENSNKSRRPLDCDATVSLLNFSPKQGASVEKYRARLKVQTEKMGAKFVLYDPAKGELRFQVTGFSE